MPPPVVPLQSLSVRHDLAHTALTEDTSWMQVNPHSVQSDCRAQSVLKLLQLDVDVLPPLDVPADQVHPGFDLHDASVTP